MLSKVGAYLRELGLTERSEGLRLYVNITTGDSLSISVYADRDRFYHVRASELVSLGPIYRAHTRAWSDHPVLVPRPWGHRRDGSWSIMVSDGVEHAAVRRSHLMRSPLLPASALFRQVLTYFLERPPVAVEDVTHARLLQTVEAGFEHSPLAGTAKRCIDEAVAAGIESMPMWLQHGDFVVNNLGRCGKRLVAFDWEDYGKVSLPGLDILTLALSLTGMTEQGTAAVVGRAGGAASLDAFLRTTCEAQALELPRFRRLVPFYLLVFLHLKRSYGVGVQQRIARLLESLASRGERSHEEL